MSRPNNYCVDLLTKSEGKLDLRWTSQEMISVWWHYELQSMSFASNFWDSRDNKKGGWVCLNEYDYLNGTESCFKYKG